MQGQPEQEESSRNHRTRLFITSHPCETETTTLGPGDFPAKSGFVIAATQTRQERLSELVSALGKEGMG